nr:MAG TPA: hypothetical protein [Caudoviricetes sp.]
MKMPRGMNLPRGPASIRAKLKSRLLHIPQSFLGIFPHCSHSSNSGQQSHSSVTASSTAARMYFGDRRCAPLSSAIASFSLSPQIQQSSSSDSM